MLPEKDSLMRCIAVLVLAFLTIPSFASAACLGKDLRDSIPAVSMQEIRAGIADVPFREGVAFEAVRDDTRLTLFGTLPLSDPAVSVPEEIAIRIRTADVVLMEVTEEGERGLQRRLAANPSIMLYLDGPGLRSRLTAAEWEALSKSLSKLGIPPESADRMRPWAVFVMLEMPPCEIAAQASGATPLDRRIEALARNAGVAVEMLDEDLEQALGFFVDAPEEKQLDMLRMSLAKGGIADDDMVATVVGTWIDEEPMVAWEISRSRAVSLIGDAEAVATLFREVHDFLITRSNSGWRAKILDRTRASRNIVIAVGALHLPGHQGLVRMLEAEGFTIRRLSVP